MNRRREALEDWDPQALAYPEPESWRLQLLAEDHDGYLRRALQAAHKAATLAETPREQEAATELLVLLEHEAGHHSDELQQAQTLVRLRHNDDRSRSIFRRAARCNRWELPAQ